MSSRDNPPPGPSGPARKLSTSIATYRLNPTTMPALPNYNAAKGLAAPGVQHFQPVPRQEAITAADSALDEFNHAEMGRVAGLTTVNIPPCKDDAQEMQKVEADKLDLKLKKLYATYFYDKKPASDPSPPTLSIKAQNVLVPSYAKMKFARRDFISKAIQKAEIDWIDSFVHKKDRDDFFKDRDTIYQECGLAPDGVHPLDRKFRKLSTRMARGYALGSGQVSDLGLAKIWSEEFTNTPKTAQENGALLVDGVIVHKPSADVLDTAKAQLRLAALYKRLRDAKENEMKNKIDGPIADDHASKEVKEIEAKIAEEKAVQAQRKGKATTV